MTDENISLAVEGVSGAVVGAKLDADAGSTGLGGSAAGNSGGLGGAGGSLKPVGADRNGEDLKGSAGGAGIAGAISLALGDTGEKVPDVVAGAVDELTGVIVGVGAAVTSSSSSSSSSSEGRLSSLVEGLDGEGVSAVVSAVAGAPEPALSCSSAISSSKSSSSSSASASSSLMPIVPAVGAGGAGGGALGSPIMLRRSGAPAGVVKPEPGVVKELEDGPTSNVDSLGTAGAPMIDVLCGGGGGGGGVNSTGGPAEKSGPIEISCGGAAFGSGANSRCTGCHGDEGSPCNSCFSVIEMSNCLNSSICLEISIKRLSVKLRKPIRASERTSGLPGGGGNPMSLGVTSPSASSCGRI